MSLKALYLARGGVGGGSELGRDVPRGENSSARRIRCRGSLLMNGVHAFVERETANASVNTMS